MFNVRKILATGVTMLFLTTPVITTMASELKPVQSQVNTMAVAHNPLQATIPSLQVAGTNEDGLYYTNGGHLTFTDYTSLYNAMQKKIKEITYNTGKTNLEREGMDATQLKKAFKPYDEIMALYKQNNIKLPEGCVPSPIWRNQCSIMFNANTTAARADWSFIPENVKDAYLKYIDRCIYEGPLYYNEKFLAESAGARAQNAFMNKYYNPNDLSRYDNIEVMEVTVDSYKDIPKDVYVIDESGLFRGVGDITFKVTKGQTLPGGYTVPGGLVISADCYGSIFTSSNGYTTLSGPSYELYGPNGSDTDKAVVDVINLDNVKDLVFTTFCDTITQTTDVNGSPTKQVLGMPKIVIFHIGK